MLVGIWKIFYLGQYNLAFNNGHVESGVMKKFTNTIYIKVVDLKLYIIRSTDLREDWIFTWFYS